MKMKSALLLAGSLCSLFTGYSQADNTQRIGGSGGSHSFSYNCATHARIAGIKVAYTEVIDDISFFCRSINHNGTEDILDGLVSGGGNWTIPKRRLEVSRHQDSATCPANTYAVAISGRTYRLGTTEGLSSISLHCARANDQGKQQGEIVETISVSAGNNNRGRNTGIKICPAKKIARGGFGRRGIFTDSVALRCVSGTPPAPFDPTPPTLITPSANSSDSFRFAGINQAFTFEQTANEKGPRYSPGSEICVLALHGNNCLQRQIYPLQNPPRKTVTLSIPDALEGTTAQWTMKTCAASNCYGQPSQRQLFHVYPKPTLLKMPLANEQSDTREVQFTWRNNTAANAGYQLVIRANGARFVLNKGNPTVPNHLPGRVLNLAIDAGASGKRVRIPTDLGSDLRWTLYSCSRYENVGRRCNPTAGSERTLRLRSSAPRSSNPDFRSLRDTTKNKEKTKLKPLK